MSTCSTPLINNMMILFIKGIQFYCKAVRDDCCQKMVMHSNKKGFKLLFLGINVILVYWKQMALPCSFCVSVISNAVLVACSLIRMASKNNKKYTFQEFIFPCAVLKKRMEGLAEA